MLGPADPREQHTGPSLPKQEILYERPRVLRTLLCLLVGVLALLWRAVPSFSWNPPHCPPGYHEHWDMDYGDCAIFCLVYIPGGHAGDEVQLRHAATGSVVYPGDPVYPLTCLKVFTRKLNAEPTHQHDCVTLSFIAYIDGNKHECCRTRRYWFDGTDCVWDEQPDIFFGYNLEPFRIVGQS